MSNGPTVQLSNCPTRVRFDLRKVNEKNAAHTETTPRPGPLTTAYRSPHGPKGKVYRVVTTLTRVTTVEFVDWETLRSIIAGDTVRFPFDSVSGGWAFAIKPAASGVATNITVYMNRRSCYFRVVEAGEAAHYVDQFRYPERRVQTTGLAHCLRLISRPAFWTCNTEPKRKRHRIPGSTGQTKFGPGDAARPVPRQPVCPSYCRI